jgi:CBS domain-containing protein
MTAEAQTLPPDATIGEARRRIQHDGHGAYPIVDPAGHCVAIIARQDILELDDRSDMDLAMSVASADVVTVTSDQSLVVALHLLLDEEIGHLPVVDRGLLVGICTRTDLLRARQRQFADEDRQPGWQRPTGAAARRRGARAAIQRREGGPVHHYLIVANQTLHGRELAEAITDRLTLGPCRFHVLVPATPPHDLYTNVLNALEGQAPDQRRADEDAQHRLTASLAWIRANGGVVDGEIGVADPLTAVSSVLERHHFDEIIVSTLPAHLSQWLRTDLPSRIERTFDLPVAHVEATGSEPGP